MPRPVLVRTLLIVVAAALPPAGAIAILFLHPLPIGLPLALIVGAIAWCALGIVVAHHLLPTWDRWLRAQRRRYRGERIACLTFDDGPEEPWTAELLDRLREAQVRATFFLLGEKAQRHPALVARIAREGHAIGNHGMHHRILALRGAPAIRAEIDDAAAAIEAAGGGRPAHVRAPHGFTSPALRRVLRERGLALVPWTKGVWDTDGADRETLLARFAKRFDDLEILLLHDGLDAALTSRDRRATVAALPAIVAEYRRRGYRFATIPELDE